MCYFQRIKNIVIGIVMLLLALLLALTPEWGLILIALALVVSLLVYGVRMLWYYITMGRYMVSGKTSLFQGIVLLDVGLFTASLISTGRLVTLSYLLVVFVFAGFVDILRSFEAKRVGTPLWRLKLIGGIVKVLVAIALGVAGFAFRSVAIPVYGFCALLAYSAAVRIYTALQKTAIVYIQ